MVTRRYHALPFYVAVALAWASAFVVMILLVRPSHASVVPVPGCLCGTWLLVTAWLGASAFAAIGFTAAALFAAGERGDR